MRLEISQFFRLNSCNIPACLDQATETIRYLFNERFSPLVYDAQSFKPWEVIVGKLAYKNFCFNIPKLHKIHNENTSFEGV